MDTIIYLMLEHTKSTGGQEKGPPVFHIREVMGEPHMVYVEIPEMFMPDRQTPKGLMTPERRQIPDGLGMPDSNMTRVQSETEEGRMSPESDWPAQLQAYLIPFLWESVLVSTLYDISVENRLRGGGYCGWWRERWQIPEFEDYHRREFAEILLERAEQAVGRPVNILVLGFEPFLGEILPRYARG